MRHPVPFAALLCALSGARALAQGDGTFQAPLSIHSPGRPGAVTVHSGDLNRDGKLDLLSANGSGTILVFIQNPRDRLDWRQVPVRVGTATFFVRAADFDHDGFDDFIAADNASVAYLVKSKGDGTFGAPLAIPRSNGARWVAIGDWDGDGSLDLATANLNASNVTVFRGDGTGRFTLTQSLPGSREHTLETGDFDGDGILDLFLGVGIPGIIPHKGLGDGKFQPRASIPNLGCVEYIAVGDFNQDGLDDLAPTCIDYQNAFVGVSNGKGQYVKTLETQAGGGTESSAIADLDGDGNADLALTSMGYTTLLVHLGKGDGGFHNPPLAFAPTGLVPSFLIAPDLDGDGRFDVVSADTVSSTLTVFWGRGGDRFLESGVEVRGFTAAKAMAAGDLDGDGKLDLFFPRSDQPRIQVYLDPAGSEAARPALTISTRGKYTALELADLDGDGVPDLVGADNTGGNVQVALLDRAGTAREDLALPAGVFPVAVRLALIDGDGTLDIAAPCKGSNHIAVFLGLGGGKFAEARIVPTVQKPKALAVADLDLDGNVDLAAITDTQAAVHYGAAGGQFTEPATILQDPARVFTDVAVAELSGDAHPDLLVSDQKTQSVYYLKGKGNREFEEPLALKVNNAPVSIAVADLNGDRRLDLVTGNSFTRSASVLLNGGTEGFAPQRTYGLGLAVTALRVDDLDGDGALDLAAFAVQPQSAILLLGRKAGAGGGKKFLRGDATGDGALEISDPIAVITRLFLGGAVLPCEDAADANDDGNLDITDPVAVIGRLFLGGAALPPPGPAACGEDPTPEDALVPCATSC